MPTLIFSMGGISFECPEEGAVSLSELPGGKKMVRYHTKKDNKIAVMIDIQAEERYKKAEEAAKNNFHNRLNATKDAVDVAPHELENSKEKGWRLRKWMVDGSRFLGIIDCAFLQKGEKIYKISYFAPVKLFYSGQKAFNQIVETFEIK